MDVSQLKTLIHVNELGSLKKAADRLHIAQPALSRQIRLLEEELGIALFERHGRGMLITEVGKEVLDHAVSVMGHLQSIRAVASNHSIGLSGIVSVGTTPTVAEIVTVPLVQRARDEHPRLSIRFTSAFTGYLLDWLQRGDIDLAVTYDPQPLKSLRIVPVMSEALLFVAAGSERLSLDHAVPFSRLADETMVLPSTRHGLRTIVEDCARQAGIRLHASVEADSLNAIVDLVRAGIGTTVLPLAPIFPLVRSGALCAAPLVEPSPARKLVIAYPADRAIGSAAKYIGATFVSIASDLVDRGIWSGHMLEQGGSA